MSFNGESIINLDAFFSVRLRKKTKIKEKTFEKEISSFRVKMANFHCNACACPLNLSSVPPSANPALSNGSRSSSTSISVKSYITNCRHMFCQNCKEKCKIKCPVCSVKCKLMEINELMLPTMRDLLEPVLQQIQNFQKRLHSAQRFHMEQNRLRRKQLIRIKRGYEHASRQETEHFKQGRKQIDKALEYNRQLKCLLRIVNISKRK